MNFKMVHENYNVSDLDRSLEFYEKALGLTERRRKTRDTPSAVILEPIKINSVTVSIVSPSICHEVMGSDAMT